MSLGFFFNTNRRHLLHSLLLVLCTFVCLLMIKCQKRKKKCSGSMCQNFKYYYIPIEF